MKVVYVPAPEHLARDAGLQLAEQWLQREAGKPRDVLIVVPVFDSVGNSPVLQRLASRYEVATARTVTRAPPLPRRVVLAVWPSAETLARITGGRPRAICVVQWLEEATNDWLAANAAQDLSGKAPSLAAPAIADPIVRVALEGMTSSINLGNLLYQVNDRDEAVLTLRLLHEHRRALDPDEIYRWALANGWPGEGAENLRKYLREVLDGRRHRTHTLKKFDDDVYRYWERKAAEFK